MKIYIAGPMTKGHLADHIRASVEAADVLMEDGHHPFMPHLCHFWDIASTKRFTYEQWMAYDKVWLLACDVMLRLPGESSGADREAKWATEAGIPVVYSMAELVEVLGDVRP